MIETNNKAIHFNFCELLTRGEHCWTWLASNGISAELVVGVDFFFFLGGGGGGGGVQGWMATLAKILQNLFGHEIVSDSLGQMLEMV